MAQDRPSMQVPAQASGRMLVGLSLSDLRTAALGARPLDGSLSGVCCAEFGLDSLLCQVCYTDDQESGRMGARWGKAELCQRLAGAIGEEG